MGKDKTGKEKIMVFNQTDVGRERQNNEDYYGYFSTPFGELIIVADGMGGYGGGEVASVMTVNIISEYVKTYKGTDTRRMLDEAVQLANKRIYAKSQEDERLRKMGTTVVIALIKGNKALIAHIGDSRCYHWRNGRIIWVTKDHTKVQAMLDRKWITPEEAQKHPDRHIILQAVGSNKPLDVEFNELILNSGDRLLLCTDGLSEYVTNAELGNLMLGNIDNVCERLIKIANERGGGDNITVQVVEYTGKAEFAFIVRRFPLLKILAVTVGLLVIILGAFFVCVYFRNILHLKKIEYKISIKKQDKLTEDESAAVQIELKSSVDDSIKIVVINQNGWRTESLSYKLQKDKPKTIWLEKPKITMDDSIIKLRVNSLLHKENKDTTIRFMIDPRPPSQPDTIPCDATIKSTKPTTERSVLQEKELAKKKEKINLEIPWDMIIPKLSTTGVKKVVVSIPVLNKSSIPVEINVDCRIERFAKLQKKENRKIGSEKQDTLKIEIYISDDVEDKEIQNLVVDLYANGQRYTDKTLPIEK